MADGEELVSARDCLCQVLGYCVCTGSRHCFCFVPEQEKDATPQVEPTSVETEEDPRIEHNRFVGWYRIENTSPLNLECGMYALEISTRAQLGRTLTEPDFRAVYDSQEMEAFNRAQKHHGVVNQYHDDQLAFVLRTWATSLGLGDIWLGVIREEVDYVLILGADDDYKVVFSEEDMENVRGLTTVWIHNDNAEERFGGMNHFSGVTLLDPDEEPANHSWPELRAGTEFRAEEGRVTELDDDDDERGQEKETRHSVETAIDLDSDAPGGQETEDEDEESVQDSSTTLSGDETISEAESSPEEGDDVETGEGAEDETGARAEQGRDTETVNHWEEPSVVAYWGRESNWEDSRGRIVWVYVAASGSWIRQIEYR